MSKCICDCVSLSVCERVCVHGREFWQAARPAVHTDSAYPSPDEGDYEPGDPRTLTSEWPTALKTCVGEERGAEPQREPAPWALPAPGIR